MTASQRTIILRHDPASASVFYHTRDRDTGTPTVTIRDSVMLPPVAAMFVKLIAYLAAEESAT